MTAQAASRKPADAPPASVIDNIETVANLEARSQEARSPQDKIADAIAGFVGTIWFVALHLVIFGAWALWNTGALGLAPFDPYPFVFLCLLVSLEAVIMSTFVLIKQNRMGVRADQRAHLDLQIGLLSEREITKALQTLDAIATRLGVEIDAESRELQAHTALDRLAREVEKRVGN
jgi:uncharacterized membrane protein